MRDLVRFQGPLDLAATLECGQCFRWSREGDSYTGVVGGRMLRVRLAEEGLEADPPTACDTARRYFHLDLDYAKIERALVERDPVLERAVHFASGLRILRQDPWETLVSFIISANNNIPRIRGIIKRLSQGLGEHLGGPFYSFPGPQRIACLDQGDLRALGLGFRAPYVLDAARMITDGGLDLEDVGRLEGPEARERLMRVSGVGPKVADCVLLFSMGKYEVFPLDVWMKRAMEHLYFQGARLGHQDLRCFAQQRFGELAGFVQAYMFHWIRCCGEDVRG
ncbi:MAG: DNA glycosylase [Bacillota bacterium]|jgi:N-glycosylase/DNA lyase